MHPLSISHRCTCDQTAAAQDDFADEGGISCVKSALQEYVEDRDTLSLTLWMACICAQNGDLTPCAFPFFLYARVRTCLVQLGAPGLFAMLVQGRRGGNPLESCPDFMCGELARRGIISLLAKNLQVYREEVEILEPMGILLGDLLRGGPLIGVVFSLGNVLLFFFCTRMDL